MTNPLAIREQARAKINLTLHVLGKRTDGYHELDSLVVFADLADDLSFEPASQTSLSIDGPFATALEGENLILKAQRVVSGWLGREIHGHFHLHKRIPVSAGVGGGSSDAAAAIRILLRAGGAENAAGGYIEKAATVGADVPVCLYNRAAWMRGLGERVTPAPAIAPLPAVLVNPRIKVPTPAVFQRLNAGPLPAGEPPASPLAGGDFSSPQKAAEALSHGRNDLEPPAVAVEPVVLRTLEAIRGQEGCLLARLSGSGPTCFGIFPTDAIAGQAAEALAREHPGWWVAPVTLN
jgi:4-diphosphocytidyl-2-C-methyl-D-erythritol kinase